ncbi:hypothetical protein GGI12_001246 [Dipsacomyces acuminosporus]|nr:hypothetical protein GGI12_001246 [Dipsacomyces acuminosporus]
MPDTERTAMFVYSGQDGATIVYLESMLTQFTRQNPHRPLHYGMVLDSHSLHPRERIRVDGETVDSSLFEECSRACLRQLKSRDRGHQSYGRNSQERLDALLIEVAVKVFERLDVTAIAVSVPLPRVSAIESMGLLPSAYAGSATSKSSDLGSKYMFTEKVIMESFRPATVICGVESLPAFMEQFPDNWRARLVYLMQQPIQIISSSQPKPIRLQLQSLARVFNIAIQFAPSLTEIPKCSGIQLGIFGPNQHRLAKLALAMCHSWACERGIIQNPSTKSTYEEHSAISPLRSPCSASHRYTFSTAIPAQHPAPLREPASWMVSGLTEARSPGRFYSISGGERILANWHYSWAETPDDFMRTGTWFSTVCRSGPSNPRLLLIHLPESFITNVRYRNESSGEWCASDYRGLLRSLYMPLRDITWDYCVFAADVLYESNVIDSNVPPTLSQHVLRDFWTQITGLHTDQIHIAPSLADALKFIYAKCSTQASTPLPQAESKHKEQARKNSIPHDYSIKGANVQLSPTPKPSPSTTHSTASRRPSLLASGFSFSTKSLSRKKTISVDSLRSRPRKLSVVLTAKPGEPPTSLPGRTKRQDSAAAAAPANAAAALKADILITGAKSFVQSTLLATQR